jgi:hypothetical protein
VGGAVLLEVPLQQRPNLGAVNGGVRLGEELGEADELLQAQRFVDVDDGADCQQALVADAARTALQRLRLRDDLVELVDDLVVDQSLLAVLDDAVDAHQFSLPAADGGGLAHLRDQLLLGLEHFLLQLVLQVADADDESLRTGADASLGEVQSRGGGEVGSERVKDAHV